ncbi:MAG TPA: HdeA/HdeB family chaperone [Ottowia sp.]|uniref:HdeA/HdeB family chaperone n=1 Tax=Ottowia sp. TaxID=1898956 RepID=UPI002B8EE6A8|nr:HdeA/HdeB family chaperone [Ottowia sp.]HMN19991.1 HdeA/HdeB family chaperone [Ottowia sp.]
MKTARKRPLLALLLAGGLSVAQTAMAAAPGADKPIVKTTCQDFLAMDETMRPKFIYYAVGHGSKGQPEAVLDVAGTDTIQPELEQYCQVNLDKSAYAHVMQTSMASEKAAAAASKGHAKAAAPAKK